MPARLIIAATLLLAACTQGASVQTAAVSQPATTTAPAALTQPTTTPAAQAHTDSVAAAIRADAYARTDATNGCPHADTDMFGWRRALILHCIYRQTDHGDAQRLAVAYLLDVPAERIARWIETACTLHGGNAETCFKQTLVRGACNSGFMFVISGNIMEDLLPNEDPDGVNENYFFRHGVTTSFEAGTNGSTTDMPMTKQEDLAARRDDAAVYMPTGLARFWRTTPASFATRFPETGPAPDVHTTQGRASWLDTVQREMRAALDSDHNRLLEAWMFDQRAAIFNAEPPANGCPT